MKVILIIALILAALGLLAIGSSAYLAIAYYSSGPHPAPGITNQTLNDKLDSDGDGLTDTQETDVYRTHPHNKDTDGDGYSDKAEIDAGYDPLTPASK